MTRRAFALALVATFAVGLFMRVAWLRADPPTTDSVGVVWHDEGAWVHNARNRALWGVWRTDDWNPVFVAPLFTALEYESFRTFGVGLWQARVVPVVSGLIAILGLVVGLHALGGRRVAAVGGAVLATNYAFVMWNRAALIESTMTACLVAAWAAYALADRRPVWGVIAGAASVAAWFTKASAAFFIAALALDVCLTIAECYTRPSMLRPDGRARAAWLTLAGLAVTAAIVAALFVQPHWTEYRFYNWQMSVTRKPEYSARALADRASWLPLVQGIFSRMWLVLAAAAAGIVAITLRWRDARPAERLLVLWVFVGLLELVVHDSGNERRYVMFIPAFTALAALLIGRAWAIGADRLTALTRPERVGLAALLLPLGYLVAGSLLRPLLLADITAGRLHTAVVLSASTAIAMAAGLGLGAPSIGRACAGRKVPAILASAWLVVVLGWNAMEYGAWATTQRANINYEASVALGRLVPSGTVIQGKLANGLSLENNIRPMFIGNGFGNYDDRLQRDDVRYILTYDLPRIGYESSDGSGLIQGILDHYPLRRVIATLAVDETPDPDRAVLIDKFPDVPPHARD